MGGNIINISQITRTDLCRTLFSNDSNWVVWFQKLEPINTFNILTYGVHLRYDEVLFFSVLFKTPYGFLSDTPHLL